MIASAPARGISATRWLLLGMIVLGVISYQGGRGTLAYFTDTATSTANTFTAGTLTLEVSNDGTTWSDAVTGSLSGSNLVPGTTYYTGDIQVRNGASSVPAKYTLTTTRTSAVSTANDALDGYLKAWMDVRSSGSCTAAPAGTGQTALFSNVAVSALDIAAGSERTLATGGSEILCIYVQFADSGAAQNDAQGGTATYSFAFEARQQ